MRRRLSPVLLLLASACGDARLDPPVSSPESATTTDPLRVTPAATDPGPMEACSIANEADYPEPPREGLSEYCTTVYLSGIEDGVACGRLITPELREAAASSDALTVLAMAAHNQYQRSHPELGPPSYTPANSIADLAVSGERKYSNFRVRRPSIDAVSAALVSRLASLAPTHVPSTTDVRAAAEAVLTRAYRVAWALRGPPSYRAANRPGLGWIAVSAEHDAPHRPVNVPVTPWPQRDLDVLVPTSTSSVIVRTRYSVAGVSEPAQTYAFGTLPAEPALTLPADARVILYVHGHSARLEESLDVTGPLLAEAARRNENVVVIAVDLPSNGYAMMLDHARVAPSAASAYPGSYPMLAFLDQFLVNFVETLDGRLPVRDRLVAVVGGSLGGNLSLRLEARRPAWLQKVVAWSPASVWDTWAGTLFVTGEGVRITRDRYNEAEGGSSRIDYFQQVFRGYGPLRIQSAQAPRWYRDGWPCKNSYILGAVRDRQEIYSPTFRQWHWRIAHEQLIFSHQDAPGALATPTLLLAGADDNAFPEHLYDNTRRLADRMTATRGDTLFLATTGHSIHNERPRLLANKVLDFATQHRVRPLRWCGHAGATVHSADFDGDGRHDLLCHTEATGVTLEIDFARDGLENRSNASVLTPFCTHAGGRLLIADVSGDGRDDLLCHTSAGGGLHVLYTEATGLPGTTAWGQPTFCSRLTETLRVGDVDGDGDDDLLCHDTSTGRTTVRRATGGAYPSGVDLLGGGAFFCSASTSRLLVGDVNADGRADLVCHSSTTGLVQIDRSTGTGVFYGSVDFSSTSGWCFHVSTQVALADADADGRADLHCLARSTGLVDVMFANASGAYSMASGASADFDFCQATSSRLVTARFFTFADGTPRGASLLCQDTVSRLTTLLPTTY